MLAITGLDLGFASGVEKARATAFKQLVRVAKCSSSRASMYIVMIKLDCSSQRVFNGYLLSMVVIRYKIKERTTTSGFTAN